MRPWLWPASWLWAAVASLRVGLYERGVLGRTALTRPTVSIGALEMGGTGKSPATAAVARVLRGAGLRPGILSRGYGRSSSGPVLVSDGDVVHADVRAAGDEPFLYARSLPGVPVAVAARREEAAALVLAATDVDVFVLDDAFQHVRVQRDADLLVVDAARPFWHQAPPPAGRLREGPGAARRAHAFLLAGETAEPCRHRLERRFPGRPVFALRVEEPGATPLLAPAEAAAGTPPQPVLPFAGIARPERFEASLCTAGVDAREPVTFPDHHWYTRDEIRTLRAEARRLGARALLTTEKDAVRLHEDDEEPPIWVWRYRLQVSSPDELFGFLEPRLEPRRERR